MKWIWKLNFAVWTIFKDSFLKGTFIDVYEEILKLPDSAITNIFNEEWFGSIGNGFQDFYCYKSTLFENILFNHLYTLPLDFNAPSLYQNSNWNILFSSKHISSKKFIIQKKIKYIIKTELFLHVIHKRKPWRTSQET